jgi:hypothetical protein
LHLIALRYITLGRTPLDGGSARRRELYLTTHKIYKRQTFMPAAGFDPAIPASERPQTHSLDRAATGIGFVKLVLFENPVTRGTWSENGPKRHRMREVSTNTEDLHVNLLYVL